MESTLDVVLKHHVKLSESVGGDYKKATKQFEKALSSKNVEAGLKKLYLKYEEQLDDISDDFHDLLMVCRAFIS